MKCSRALKEFVLDFYADWWIEEKKNEHFVAMRSKFFFLLSKPLSYELHNNLFLTSNSSPYMDGNFKLVFTLDVSVFRVEKLLFINKLKPSFLLPFQFSCPILCPHIVSTLIKFSLICLFSGKWKSASHKTLRRLMSTNQLIQCVLVRM